MEYTAIRLFTMMCHTLLTNVGYNVLFIICSQEHLNNECNCWICGNEICSLNLWTLSMMLTIYRISFCCAWSDWFYLVDFVNSIFLCLYHGRHLFGFPFSSFILMFGHYLWSIIVQEFCEPFARLNHTSSSI